MKLLDYIRGLRKGKEAHRLERESMQDPFLADAMDGYSQLGGNTLFGNEHFVRHTLFQEQEITADTESDSQTGSDAPGDSTGVLFLCRMS